MSHSGAIGLLIRFALAAFVALNCCFCTGGKIQAVSQPADPSTVLGNQAPQANDVAIPGETGHNLLKNSSFSSGQIEPFYTLGDTQLRVLAPEGTSANNYVGQISSGSSGSLVQDLQCSDIPGGCQGGLSWGVIAAASTSATLNCTLSFLGDNGEISHVTFSPLLGTAYNTYLSTQTATFPAGAKGVRFKLDPSPGVTFYISATGVFLGN